jgi:hypothetical protein
MRMRTCCTALMSLCRTASGPVDRRLCRRGGFSWVRAALTDAWSVRQFEYPWLHSHAHIHRFLDGHQDALDFAAQKAGLELTAAGRLMAAWLELKPEH